MKRKRVRRFVRRWIVWQAERTDVPYSIAAAEYIAWALVLCALAAIAL